MNPKYIKFIYLLSLLRCICTKDLVRQIIQSNNYVCETHRVQTPDGYILTVHRIPPKDYINNPTPFILMHGIIGSAADFLLPGARRALGFLLHERGYDVWLPNSRGTTYSKDHMNLEPSMPEFWNFTWHEIGYYDLPSVIEYITQKTGHEMVHYAGHSQGTTVLLVMLSERPEYNARILSAHLMAPEAFLFNIMSPPIRFLIAKDKEVEMLLNHLGLHELFPSTTLNQLGAHFLCGEGVPTQSLCILVTYLSVGFSEYEMDKNLFPKIFETTPAGISRKQFKHFLQMIISGKFRQFDYGSRQDNYKMYNRKTPPEYNLQNVQIPLNLFYGTKDFLNAKQDVIHFTLQLKNTSFILNEVRGFNHIDLLYSTEAPRFIYRKIINYANRYHN